jgi:hypothetical protein
VLWPAVHWWCRSGFQSVSSPKPYKAWGAADSLLGQLSISF